MNTFALFIAFGAGLGLYQVYRNAPVWAAGRRVDAALVVLLGGLMGARIGYALRFPGGGLAGLLRFWEGGLNLEGALAGALLSLALTAAWMRFSFGRLADALSVMVPPLWVAGWLGCWQAGCGYGAAVEGGAWWALPVMDETGQVIARFPLQLAAAVIGLAIFLLLGSLPRHSSRAGVYAAVTGLALGLNLLGVSFLAADGRVTWGGLHPLTWVGGGLAVVSLAGLAAARWRVLMVIPAWLEKRRFKVQH